ncbi:unnamed protein product [Prunus brigantina]
MRKIWTPAFWSSFHPLWQMSKSDEKAWMLSITPMGKQNKSGSADQLFFYCPVSQICGMYYSGRLE